MDQCREQLAKQLRKQLQVIVPDLQRELAIEIEDLFDENNPYSRGNLRAKVSGNTLDVRMRGNFEGRARHSQDQVDMWCERGEGLFNKITLRNSHGTFSCQPDEGPKQLIARIVEEAQVAPSWYVVGKQPIPREPEPLPPASVELEQREAELLAELDQLEAAAASYEQRGVEIAEQEQLARTASNAVDSRDRSRVHSWRTKQIQRAGHTQIAGGVLERRSV